MTKGFNVTFLKEADEFLDSLDDKAERLRKLYFQQKTMAK